MPLRHPRSSRLTLLLAAWLAGAAGVSAQPVLIDHYRGWGDNSAMQPPASNSVNAPRWLPNKAQGPYYDSTPRPFSGTPQEISDGRFAAIQSLLAFAVPDGSNALTGTPLPPARADLYVPRDSGVLCEYDRATPAYGPNAGTAACQNNVMGAVMHVALLVPKPGYQIRFGPGPGPTNDGAVIDAATSGGPAYRTLAYTTKVLAGGYITQATATANGYANSANEEAPLPTTAPQQMLNLRVAWNNWGADAVLNVQWKSPDAGSVWENIPASALKDPSKNETYIDAVDDDFSATPVVAGAGVATASVFDSDTVNSAPATAANIASHQVIGPWPPGITLNADGTISVAAGVPSGPYTVRYEICQAPGLCDQANVTIQVASAPQPAATVTAVPTLGHWGLMLTGLLAAGLGARRLRRRG